MCCLSFRKEKNTIAAYKEKYHIGEDYTFY